MSLRVKRAFLKNVRNGAVLIYPIVADVVHLRNSTAPIAAVILSTRFAMAKNAHPRARSAVNRCHMRVQHLHSVRMLPSLIALGGTLHQRLKKERIVLLCRVVLRQARSQEQRVGPQPDRRHTKLTKLLSFKSPTRPDPHQATHRPGRTAADATTATLRGQRTPGATPATRSGATRPGAITGTGDRRSAGGETARPLRG